MFFKIAQNFIFNNMTKYKIDEHNLSVLLILGKSDGTV
jgi:hypothetical protein